MNFKKPINPELEEEKEIFDQDSLINQSHNSSWLIVIIFSLVIYLGSFWLIWRSKPEIVKVKNRIDQAENSFKIPSQEEAKNDLLDKTQKGLDSVQDRVQETIKNEAENQVDQYLESGQEKLQEFSNFTNPINDLKAP